MSLKASVSSVTSCSLKYLDIRNKPSGREESLDWVPATYGAGVLATTVSVSWVGQGPRDCEPALRLRTLSNTI